MNFAQLLRNEARWTLTENGAYAVNTTRHSLLDMFGSLAAMRGRKPADLIQKFELAFQEDPLGALRCLFYVRDVRGGQGERDIFRILLRHAAQRYPDVIRCNLPCIPFYGRYDDLYCLMGTPVEDDMWALVRAQLDADRAAMEQNQPVSLLAKWLKKANSSNRITKELGIYTAKKLGLSVYDYKRICSSLRKYMDVVEIKMSDRQWPDIRYEAVPSRAMMIYRKAFLAHDPDRFQKYLAAASSGEVKINASTLYPYDIVEKILYHNDTNPVLAAQWDALPDYVRGEANYLVMADVSGSMYGRPMASSIALAMYFAQRNQGPWHNLFMTFSSNPHIVEMQGKTIWEKVSFISKAAWGMDTNFQRAMELVLLTAVQNHCKQEELPKALLVITDMEFNRADHCDKQTFYRHVQEMFHQAGYRAPTLVFWNVNSRNDVFHAEASDTGTVLVSGQSASTFENLIRYLHGEKPLGPMDFMYQVLNGERYQIVQLPE